MKLQQIAAALALMGAAQAMAIPAKPGVSYNMVQPDGSVVTLTKHGDEFGHYYLTSDSKMVVEANGAYFFGKIGPDGLLSASDVLAANLEKRSAAQQKYAEGMCATDMMEAFSQVRANAPRANAPRVSDAATDTDTEAVENPSFGVGLFPNTTYPSIGQVNGLVFLVEYQDVKFTRSDEETFKYFNSLLNARDYTEENAVGSAYDYFALASQGRFDPTFDVYGPITLPENRAFYGENTSTGSDKNPEQMVMHAADVLLEQGVDFSKYDNDGDGIVDNVYVYYAGNAEADTDISDAVWPHSYKLSYKLYPLKGYKVGDVYLNSYACGNEIQRDGSLDGVSTFIHEFSHVMGLPDLYDTSGVHSASAMEYSVMDIGVYNGSGRIPPIYSTFERNALKWIDLEVITGPTTIYLENLLESNKGYIIPTDNKKEFFLIENRQQISWDKKIPYHGMLIWHIDYLNSKWTYNTVNNDASHQRVDLIKARGKASNIYSQRQNYPFPSKLGITSFTYETTPSMRTWADDDLGLPITDIAEKDGIITATVAGGAGIADGIADIPGINISGRTITAEEPFAVVDLLGRAIGSGTQVTAPSSGIYFITMRDKSSKIAIK